MKKLNIFTIIFIMLFSIKMSSQDSLYSAKFSFETSFSKTKFNKVGFYSAFVLSFKKHKVFLGPGIYYLTAAHSQPFAAMQMGYQYFPNGTENRFTLFFGYDFNYTKGSLEDKFQPSSYYEYYGIVSRKHKYTALDNFFSFGFNWRFFSRFYFKPNVGIGVGLYKENYTYKYENGKTYTADNNLSYRYPFGFSHLAKITLGYDLVRLKKH